MKAFSIECEDAFHEKFKGISFPDDAAIHIWREAWFAALKSNYAKEGQNHE